MRAYSTRDGRIVWDVDTRVSTAQHQARPPSRNGGILVRSRPLSLGYGGHFHSSDTAGVTRRAQSRRVERWWFEARVHAARVLVVLVEYATMPSASFIAERRRMPTAALASMMLSARRAASAMPLA